MTIDQQIILRLIKYYILNHQGCSSKDIKQFLAGYDWGLKKDFTSYEIGKLIMKCVSSKRNDAFVWFRKSVVIEKKYGNNVYFVKE